MEDGVELYSSCAVALNIEDPETDRLARELAALTGEKITDAVRRAVMLRIEQERRHRGKTIDPTRLREIQDAFAAVSVADDRSADELVGYDDIGLPR